jgi:hypothetical protein
MAGVTAARPLVVQESEKLSMPKVSRLPLGRGRIGSNRPTRRQAVADRIEILRVIGSGQRQLSFCGNDQPCCQPDNRDG